MGNIWETTLLQRRRHQFFTCFPLTPHKYPHLHKCGLFVILEGKENFMSRISIDVTPEEHSKLKAPAALSGKSMREFVLERTLN